jgi:hypothetical protein
MALTKRLIPVFSSANAVVSTNAIFVSGTATLVTGVGTAGLGVAVAVGRGGVWAAEEMAAMAKNIKAVVIKLILFMCLQMLLILKG